MVAATLATASRRCACGGIVGPSGDCAVCRAKRLGRGLGLAPPTVHDVLRSPGQPLEVRTRAAMEARLGHDFGSVRVHADPAAARAADSISADAFTVGRDVAFARGRFAPATPTGAQLLAHELAHVVQQRAAAPAQPLGVAPAGVHEREAEAATPRTPLATRAVQRQPRPGSSTFENRVSSTSTNTAHPGITAGTVQRTEFGEHHRSISTAMVNVSFDANACVLTVPVHVQLRTPTATDLSQCPVDAGQTVSALPAAGAQQIFARYLEQANDRLNRWYTVRLTSCDGGPCAGRDIPIRAEVTAVTSNPDYTLAVLSGAGRSCVRQQQGSGPGSVVLIGRGGSFDLGMLAHESGHMTLGVGDEYHEEQLAPQPVERERPDDWSLMADHYAYEGLATLHERHFGFATAFLQDVVHRPDGTPCRAELREVSRPFDREFTFNIGGGYAQIGGAGGIYAGLGGSFDFLSRSRALRFGVGPQLQYLSSLSSSIDEPQRMAFLMGVRASVEGRLTSSSGGLRAGAFGEAGGGEFLQSGGRLPSTSAFRPYALGGVTAGYGFGPDRGSLLSVFAEAAAGTTVDVSNPDHIRFFQLGVGLRVER